MVNRRILAIGCAVSLLLHLLVMWVFFDSNLFRFSKSSPVVESEKLQVHIAQYKKPIEKPDTEQQAAIAPEPVVDIPEQPEPVLPPHQPATVTTQQQSEVVKTTNRSLVDALQEKRPDFSRPFVEKEIVTRDPKTGGITNEMWGLNPRFLEKLQQARADRKERDKHRAEVDKLNRHLFAMSGKRESSTNGSGVRYERIGNGYVAHDLFRYFGAGYQGCWRIVTLPNGKEERTSISCELLKPLSGAEISQLYVHPSLQTPEEKRKNLKLKKKTLDEQFIDQLSKELAIDLPEKYQVSPDVFRPLLPDEILSNQAEEGS